MKILVFTTDVLPLSDVPTNGMSLRTQGLISGLMSRGHQVVASIPKTAFESCVKLLARDKNRTQALKALESQRDLIFDENNQLDLISSHSPDLVVFAHWPAMTFSEQDFSLRYPNSADRPKLAIDLAGPVILQRKLEGKRDLRADLCAKCSILARADIWICSSPDQEQYFRSFLSSNSEINQPIVVHSLMTLPPTAPAQIAQNSRRQFIYAGLFLPWQNPINSLETLVEHLEETKNGNLHILGGTHPYYKFRRTPVEKKLAKLQRSRAVSVSQSCCFEIYCKHLSNADIAIDLMEKNEERQLAVPVRTATYLWAGLPVIYNNYSYFSKLIEEYDAGWCLDPEDRNGLRALLNQLDSDTEVLRRKSENAKRLALSLLTWDNSLTGLSSALKTILADRVASIRSAINS